MKLIYICHFKFIWRYFKKGVSTQPKLFIFCFMTAKCYLSHKASFMDVLQYIIKQHPHVFPQ